jgi:Protein of unknown function (DUF2804)
MPLRWGGELRKRWRYVALFGPQVMLCAARVQIGPLSQSFWAVWDREEGRRFAHTRMRPGGGEVRLEGPELEVHTADVRASLRLGEGEAVECVCPSGERGFGWTRKRAGIPIRGRIEAGGRSWEIEGAGVEDESAGYHQRRTSWHWSAGVGRAADGRTLAWNLVNGINDPPRGSERAVWIDGAPSEPDPVAFDGLGAVRFADGSELSFSSESERARNDNLLLVRSRYRHCFGTFGGRLDGIELGEGFGVMEQHEALW